MIRVAPERQDTSLGGMPTSTRTTATLGNVTTTIIMLFTLPPLVYYMWICLAFNRGHLDAAVGRDAGLFPAADRHLGRHRRRDG